MKTFETSGLILCRVRGKWSFLRTLSGVLLSCSLLVACNHNISHNNINLILAGDLSLPFFPMFLGYVYCQIGVNCRVAVWHFSVDDESVGNRKSVKIQMKS